MLSAGQNSTQIAAPQSATNQASESQKSRSSRFMNRLARRADRKMPVHFRTASQTILLALASCLALLLSISFRKRRPEFLLALP